MPGVRGRRILIVEDEYPVAADLSRYFRKMGALVIGPVGSVAAAESKIGIADAAVLGIDVNGEDIYPVADELARRGVPFVFFTGHSGIVVPNRFQHTACLQKPAGWDVLFEAPLSGRETGLEAPAAAGVVSILPKLRLSARLMMGDSEAADRLVELTLERAIAGVHPAPVEDVEIWLSGLLDETYRRYGARLLH